MANSSGWRSVFKEDAFYWTPKLVVKPIKETETKTLIAVINETSLSQLLLSRALGASSSRARICIWSGHRPRSALSVAGERLNFPWKLRIELLHFGWPQMTLKIYCVPLHLRHHRPSNAVQFSNVRVNEKRFKTCTATVYADGAERSCCKPLIIPESLHRLIKLFSTTI